jgi:hypothetical protein
VHRDVVDRAQCAERACHAAQHQRVIAGMRGRPTGGMRAPADVRRSTALEEISVIDAMNSEPDSQNGCATSAALREGTPTATRRRASAVVTDSRNVARAHLELFLLHAQKLLDVVHLAVDLVEQVALRVLHDFGDEGRADRLAVGVEPDVAVRRLQHHL